MFVVEMCLVDGLERIFTPSVVAGFEDPELETIAGESQAVKQRRVQLSEKRNKLQRALDRCVSNSPSSSAGQ